MLTLKDLLSLFQFISAQETDVKLVFTADDIMQLLSKNGFKTRFVFSAP